MFEYLLQGERVILAIYFLTATFYSLFIYFMSQILSLTTSCKKKKSVHPPGLNLSVQSQNTEPDFFLTVALSSYIHFHNTSANSSVSNNNMAIIESE